MSEKQSKKNIKLVVPTRGRTFKGLITKKFPHRVVVEFDRTVFVPKYERYYRKKTRLHARLPEEIKADVGDMVIVKECRPLSKIIHFIVTKKINSPEVKQ